MTEPSDPQVTGPSETKRLLARWVFPVDSDPIERGLIEIQAGRITAVHPLHGFPGRDVLDLGNCAIIPGLINAHAHLEFSGHARPIEPPQPFSEWIRNLVASRSDRTAPQAQLVRDGLSECAENGTTTVAEVATGEWKPEFAGDELPAVVAFKELIGPLPEHQTEQIQTARQFLDDCRRSQAFDNGQLVPAVTPHAPYSVSPELFSALVDLARQEDVLLMTHLAETRAELELLASGTGEMRGLMEGFGQWQPGLIARGTRALDYLKQLATLRRALIAHGNYLADDEIEFLAAHPTITTVFCPRTHRFFGHDPHPWLRLLNAGASVAIGTDGRCSNPDYSLWSELQFLNQKTQGSLMPRLLALGTIAGARSLGLEQQTGTLAVGKRADLCVLRLPSDSHTDGWSALFDPATTIHSTMARGQFISGIAANGP